MSDKVDWSQFSAPALQSPGDFHQALLNRLPLGVVLLDTHGRVTYHNHTAQTLLAGDCIGQVWREIVAKHHQALNDDSLTITTYPYTNQQGQLILLSYQTPTAQESKLMLMGKMIATLAHQIKTPLATVLLHLSNLGHPALETQKRDQILTKAKGQIKNLEFMVDDLLLFSRDKQPKSETLDLMDVITDCIESLRGMMAKKSINLNLSGQKSYQIYGNKRALRGALQNVLANAIDASDKHQTISLAISGDAQQCSLSIQDHGSGMSQETLSKIFDAFYSEKAAGNGLGLTIAKTTIEAHQGALSLHSLPNIGTEVIITLPLAVQGKSHAA